jgi:lysophospholipase L1-like esterase
LRIEAHPGQEETVHPRGRFVVRALLALLCALTALSVPATAGSARSHWFSAWSRPQSVVAGAAADSADGGRPGPLLRQSVRDIVRLAGDGSAIRVRLSNRYGASLSPDATLPLQVLATTVGRRRSGADLDPRTLRSVRFGGHQDVTIPAGGTVVSDPITLPVRFGDDLAVSLWVGLVPVGPQHGASFVTSYVSPLLSGDHTRDVSGAAYTERTFSTLVLTGVDVRSSALRGVIATTGGSVTDGFGTEIDSHSDFPAWLAARIHREVPADRRHTVVNNGLGGTTAAAACAIPGAGPSVEERVAHDSLSLPGVTHLIVYAGTNDLGDGCGAAQILAGYRSIIRQAHARGVRVLISTITPRASYSASTNAQRELVNAWVRGKGRCSGECDRSLDFDVVVRDPADHNRIAPKLDSGDGIHPTGEGYRRIAASIPLAAFS